MKQSFKTFLFLSRRLLSFLAPKVPVWLCLSSAGWCLLWWLISPAEVSTPTCQLKSVPDTLAVHGPAEPLPIPAGSCPWNVSQRHMHQRLVSQPGEVVGNSRTGSREKPLGYCGQVLEQGKEILASSSFSFFFLAMSPVPPQTLPPWCAALQEQQSWPRRNWNF